MYGGHGWCGKEAPNKGGSLGGGLPRAIQYQASTISEEEKEGRWI